MKIKRIIAISLCGLFANPITFAGDMGALQDLSWKPVLGAGGGVAISTDAGTSQNFPITTAPGLGQFYNYANNNATQTQGMFEVFLGAEHSFHTDWRIQPGIAYSQAGTYNVKGVLTQGLTPQSADQFNYHYNITTRQLLAQAKLMHTYHQIFYPYFLLGLGASFNNASSFGTNIPANLISTRMYANNLATSFSYRVGLGFDADVYAHTRLGVAYRYSGLGAVNFGNSTIDGVTVPQTLSQSQMNANEVLFQLTYII